MDNTGYLRVVHSGFFKRYVHPFIGILANISRHQIDGKMVGHSGNKERDCLRKLGFNVERVKPIWTNAGHSGFTCVEFGCDFSAFSDAIKCEAHFIGIRHGRNEYFDEGPQDEELFFWVAKEEDYRDGGVVGGKLRESKDLKSLESIFLEEARTAAMVAGVSGGQLSALASERAKVVGQLEEERDKMMMFVSRVEDVIREIYWLNVDMATLRSTLNVLKTLLSLDVDDNSLYAKLDTIMLELSMKESQLGSTKEMYSGLMKHIGNLLNAAEIKRVRNQLIDIFSENPSDNQELLIRDFGELAKMPVLSESEIFCMFRACDDVPRRVLWNAKDGRVATLKEGISALVAMYKKAVNSEESSNAAANPPSSEDLPSSSAATHLPRDA